MDETQIGIIARTALKNLSGCKYGYALDAIMEAAASSEFISIFTEYDDLRGEKKIVIDKAYELLTKALERTILS